MPESNARQLARTSQFYLQEAVLELLSARKDGFELGQIAKILALPGTGYNSVITGQLHVLRNAGRVHQPRGAKTEWALTEEERLGGLDYPAKSFELDVRHGRPQGSPLRWAPRRPHVSSV